jgi:hypothetical protein
LAACVADYSPDAYNQPFPDAGRDDDSMPLDAGPRDLPDARPPGAGPCDLSGSWLVTERMTSSGLGAEQIINAWFYFELVQEGSEITVAKSVACGSRVRGLDPFPVSMDDTAAWPSYMRHTSYEGRRGSSKKAGSGCNVTFEKDAYVRGATVETYRDLSVPLPTIDQQASGSEPGWEDWEGDGEPGITIRVNGSASGTLYLASRTWTSYAGSIAASADTFNLPIDWAQERSTLALDGPQLLLTEVGRAPDPSKHLVEFSRLSDEESSGSDSERCETIRTLAPTLTPMAMK